MEEWCSQGDCYYCDQVGRECKVTDPVPTNLSQEEEKEEVKEKVEGEEQGGRDEASADLEEEAKDWEEIEK